MILNVIFNGIIMIHKIHWVSAKNIHYNIHRQNPTGLHTQFLGVFVLFDLQFFCVVFCRSLFVPFLYAIVLSALIFADYPFGNFKLFFLNLICCVKHIYLDHRHYVYKYFCLYHRIQFQLKLHDTFGISFYLFLLVHGQVQKQQK